MKTPRQGNAFRIIRPLLGESRKFDTYLILGDVIVILAIMTKWT